MRMQRQIERCGWLLLIALCAMVLAFMGLSLAVTATGTARFAVAMGYHAEVGYAVCAVFDLAKGLLPVALLVLLARRAFLLFIIIGFAWLGLVTYSALATHATVSTAIAAIERTGSWKTEVRSDTQSELDAVEKRLAILAQPFPPRAAFRGRKRIRSRTASRDERAAHPSNVVPMPEARREAHTTDETRTSPRSIGWDISLIVDHIADFVRECLEPASGSSLGASELRATYEAWCADHDYEPLSQQKLGAELTGLGFTKWKSCGLIRYRDLQLVA